MILYHHWRGEKRLLVPHAARTHSTPSIARRNSPLPSPPAGSAPFPRASRDIFIKGNTGTGNPYATRVEGNNIFAECVECVGYRPWHPRMISSRGDRCVYRSSQEPPLPPPPRRGCSDAAAMLRRHERFPRRAARRIEVSQSDAEFSRAYPLH